MYSLGIDLGGTNIVASVVDDQFNIISTAKTKTNAPRPANAIFDDVEKVCREAVREAKLTMSDLVAVGMGSPGTCNADGVIEFANNLAFNNVPAREMLRERLGVDNVFVENDANCAALGEAFAGCGNGSKNFVAVTLGTGVGGGVLRDVLSNQKPYIFVKHFYACPTLIGALLCALCWQHLGDIPSMLLGAAVILVLRLCAAHFRWGLPHAADLPE